jgi:chromosome segregation ATPase
LLQADSQVRSLESELASATKRLGEMQRALADSQDNFEDIQAEKRQVDERLAILERETARSKARIAELDALVVSLQESARGPDLEQELKLARQALDELQGSFDASIAHKLTEVSKLVRERDEARRCIEQNRLDMERLLASVAQDRDAARCSLLASQDKAEDLEAALEALREQLSKLQIEARRHDEEAMKEAAFLRDDAAARAQSAQREHEHEVAGLEQVLKERGREIRLLRDDISHNERLVRELIQRVDSGSQGEPSMSLEPNVRERLELLLSETAIREGELQKARWRIAELEQQVRDQEHVEKSKDISDLEHALFAAQNELDAMRQALASERAAHRQANERADRFIEPKEASRPTDQRLVQSDAQLTDSVRDTVTT